MQITRNDISKKNIELSINHSNDVPLNAKGDASKFKQIMLNLLMQSLAGTYKGVVKLKTDLTYFDHIPHVSVEIENSKFELHKKDNMKIL